MTQNNPHTASRQSVQKNCSPPMPACPVGRGEMGEDFVRIDSLSVQYGNKTVLKDLSWTYARGQHWVLGGQSGTGKSTLAKAIAGLIKQSGHVQVDFEENNSAKPTALYVPNWYEFTNLEGDRNFYYQQRYNRHQGQDTLTVGAELQHYATKENFDFEQAETIVEALGFSKQLDSQLIELSSGEHKKLQLVKALWHRSQLLLLDEPYTGLDTASRKALNRLLDQLASEGTHLILITNDHQLPQAINHFAEVRDGQLVEVSGITDFKLDQQREAKALPAFLRKKPPLFQDPVINLNNVTVRYGDKVVLDQVSWEVNTGEKWLLQGPNGSGKSTLLSLINGDHPQAYGHDITLFGNKRGSGESIWEIKEKIGMISPEMHWYFDQNATVWHTVASGFYDSIGWFIDVKFEEKQKLQEILDFFDLTAVKDELLTSLPLGKQRLALLARTIVKNPPLLVLDEPCQGLDSQQTQYFNDVVDELSHYGKTLIYVGHYASQLPSCIEHRIVLEQGKVILNENLLENTSQLNR